MREPVDWPTVDLLTHRASATPGKTGLIDVQTGTRWTFREYSRRVDRVAADLADVAGGRIGVLMGTRPASAVVFFAAMRTGTTVVSLPVTETATELASKVERTDLEAVVCEAETEQLALELADGPLYSVDEPTHERVRALAGTDEPAADDPTATGGKSAVTPTTLERASTQLIMFTSGTSGEPKAVRLTVGNLVASATASSFRLGVLPDDRWLCCLPTYHMGGLAPVVRSVLYGTAVVIQRAFDPDATARVIDEYGITGVSLVPTMLTRLLDAGWSAPDSLRFVLLGGAPATTELIDRCREHEVPACPTYGMTETASQIATATPAEAAAHPGTVGQPLEFTDVSIVDDAGEPVEPGETGEIVVAGPTVTPGYLDDERTAAAFDEHGLHTGDAGYRDDDGRLWVRGRRSDRIVTGGENVDPDEVADALRSHPSVADAAVVGLPDAEWGERVAALVVPGDERPSPESLLDHCEGRLAGFKRPKTIGFAEDVPRTASGTVDREAVRDRLERDGVDATDDDAADAGEEI